MGDMSLGRGMIRESGESETLYHMQDTGAQHGERVASASWSTQKEDLRHPGGASCGQGEPPNLRCVPAGKGDWPKKHPLHLTPQEAV